MGSYYEGKVVVVTGAASGIGAALARALTQQATALVVLADVDEAGAAALADELTRGRAGRVEAARLDVRDGDAFRALADGVRAREWRIDVLFNNAGIAVGGEAEGLTQAHWDRVIDVNVRGVVHGVRAVYPEMLERGDGHVVNTASLAGLVPAPLMTPYSLSKHAVVGLSASLRIEARDRGVRVTAFCPGPVDTPLLDARGPDDLPPIRIDARSYLRRGLGREHPVEKIASAALAGVAKNRALVVAPAKARYAWRLQRLSPGLVARVFGGTVRKERAARARLGAERPGEAGRERQPGGG